jgi:uncharacterized protein YecE (DUF72 family)
MAIRIGNCSWTEKTLIQSKEFYPKGVSTAEERLRYYSNNFDVVEVDSSYYAIPSVKTAGLWAERTLQGFIFHIKAYGPLTGHSADLRSLPQEARDLIPTESIKDNRITVKDRQALKTIFSIFREALKPLTSSGKLGIIVFQYPPYFLYKAQNLDYILFCREMMNNFRIGVEFRHGSWLTEKRREEIFRFLRENDLIYISADEPQYGTMATIPFVPEATADIAYIRLHGRNKKNWLRRGIETSERYNYLYSDDELRSFIPAIRGLNEKAEAVHVMFNNCHGGFSISNSVAIKKMIEEN